MDNFLSENLFNLFEAVKNNDLDGTRNLIELCVATNTADILEKDNKGFTLLHHSSARGYLEITKLLIESGADVSAKVSSCGTAVDFALRGGHLEIVKLLVESMLNNRKSGVSNANTDILEKYENWSLLYCASVLGHLDIVKYLMQSGLNIEIVDEIDRTAIYEAKTEEIKEFLMEQLEIQQNRYLLK